MDILIISLLILLGIILLVIEVAMIPGVGVTGIVGSLSLIASILYAFYYINALAGWITLFIVLFAFITIFLWFIYGKPI
ncbi:MAG: nodulation efficiency protein D (NfeD), partial [Bacteroidaceae bacterium]|nr:nodulation efficiency protein D (NfeD) [Bacteroidaceae bacterium]